MQGNVAKNNSNNPLTLTSNLKRNDIIKLDHESFLWLSHNGYVYEYLGPDTVKLKNL